MSEIKNGGLDQYGAGPFEQQQFGTAGVEGVNNALLAADNVQNDMASCSGDHKRENCEIIKARGEVRSTREPP